MISADESNSFGNCDYIWNICVGEFPGGTVFDTGEFGFLEGWAECWNIMISMLEMKHLPLNFDTL